VLVKRQIIVSGLLGGVVIFAWLVVSTGILRIGATPIRPLPDQAELHAALKKRITEVGTYACLYISSEKEASQYPNYLNEPLYAITYKGYTHNTVPGFKHPGLLGILLAPVVAAWLLAKSSDGILARYWTRVLFVTVLGLLLALGGDWPRAMASEDPASRLLPVTAKTIVAWLLAGLVISWRIKARSA
jgi:hypothetical protein